MYYRYATTDWRTNGTNESDASANYSSDNATKQGTEAAGASNVGSSASLEKKPSALEDSSSVAGERSDPTQLVLIPMDDYRPGLTVRVVDRLPAPIVVQLLRLPNGETVPVLERPDEYLGYIVRSEFRTDLVHSTTVVFTRESLESDTGYTFEADAQVFSTQLNLFRTTVHRIS